jgi:hypothetical protein
MLQFELLHCKLCSTSSSTIRTLLLFLTLLLYQVESTMQYNVQHLLRCQPQENQPQFCGYVSDFMDQSPLSSHVANQEIPCLYGRRTVITIFTRVHHWTPVLGYMSPVDTHRFLAYFPS